MTAVPAAITRSTTSVSPGSREGMLPTPKARRTTASGGGVSSASRRAAVMPGARSITTTSWRA